MPKGAVDISMLGDKQLERQLRTLPDRVQKKIVRSAFVKAARPILIAVRRSVPGSGDNQRLLRKGIKARMGRRTRRQRVARFIALPSRESLGIPGDAPHYWPAALEYGHVSGKERGRFVPPRSYLRKGFDETERQAFGIVKSEIGSGIGKEWLKR